MIGFAFAALATTLASTPTTAVERSDVLVRPIHFIVRDETITEEEYLAFQDDHAAKTSGRFVTPYEGTLGNNGVFTTTAEESKPIVEGSSVRFERVAYRVVVIRTPTGAELIVRDGRSSPEATQVLTFGFDGKETARVFVTRDTNGKVERHLLRAVAEQM